MSFNTTILSLLAGAAFSTLPLTEALAQSDCTALSHWSQTTPPVNQEHIFCGEWDKVNNKIKGFHSRPKGKSPATIKVKVTESPNQQGIYGISWNYLDSPGLTKYSTMFPDSCTQPQILLSILYAAQHSQTCPAGAPSWAQCGPNQPSNPEVGYCAADDGSTFIIAAAFLGKKINTAFPLKLR